MKKLILLSVLMAVACFTQARTWTNTKGQTLEAELVRVKDGRVFLKLDKNRQIRPLELTTLSDADKLFVEQHLQQQADQAKMKALQERKAKWHESYKDAKAEAEEYDLPILLLYTAPAWCGYCVKLEDRVYDTSDFKKFANANLVLLMADFSKPSDKEKWLKKNSIVSEKFKAGGYPTTIFISTEAEQLGRLGGFKSEWSTDTYIQKMKEIIAKKP